MYGWWALVACVVLTAGAPGVARASAWRLQRAPAPQLGSGQLVALSCPSRRVCVAVGSARNRIGVQVTLAARWNGRRWALRRAATPRGAIAAALSDVACVSVRRCFAVGSFTDDSGHKHALAERWSRGRWSIQPTPGGDALTAVSCSSAKRCLAVGQGRAEHWNGRRWSQKPVPAGVTLNDVSCPSAKTCIAVGSRDVDIETLTLAERWDGRRWRRMRTPTEASGNDELAAVSCVSASSCLAVGSFSETCDTCGPSQTAEHWNGRRWSDVEPPSEADFSSLSGVSCVSGGDCTAVGQVLRGPGDEDLELPFAAHWNGRRWSRRQTLRPRHTATGALVAVSCARSATCLAMGSFDTRGGTLILAARRARSGWRSQRIRTPNSAALSWLDGVSCSSPGACVAVGGWETAGNTPAPLAERWDGRRWSMLHPPLSAGRPSSFAKVSCASPTACMALGTQGAATEQWDGKRWSVQPLARHRGWTDELDDVSCASAASCLAVGVTRGQVGFTPVTAALAEVWDGTRWAIRSPPPPSAVLQTLLGVSCVSPTACTAVGWTAPADGSGAAQTLAEAWNGSAWTVESTPPDPAGSVGASLSGVSCAGVLACTAVGTNETLAGRQTLAERWDGTKWTLQAIPQPSDKVNEFGRVSCAAQTACTAVGSAISPRGARNVEHPLADTWNGAGWTVEATPAVNPLGAGFSDVACLTPATCVAVGGISGEDGSQLMIQRRG